MFSNRDSKFLSLFESLEERVLFDAAPDAAMALPPQDVVEEVPAQVEQAGATQSQSSLQLIVIDSGVADADALISEILESRNAESFEILALDPTRDGVSQISEHLEGTNGKYSAIHIVSHGDEGEVQLGDTTLSSDNLLDYAEQMAGWADALSEDADLLFYGCDLAGNAEGQHFIESISAITGADVAASDDLTGSADKGGDWDLEETVGTIETATLSATNWDHVLLDTDGDGLDDADDLDDDNDGILDTDEGFVPAVTESLNNSTLNSPSFPTNTELQDAGQPTGDGTTATLDGLFGGVLDFEATLVNDANPGDFTWQDGVQIRSNATLGEFIFVQPFDNGTFEGDSAVYTFDFNNEPVDNFSLVTGGINNFDTAIYEAFFEGEPVTITAANFSNLDPGVVVIDGDTLQSANTGGGTSVESNRGTLTINEPIDQLIIRTGKGDGSNSTVTLGFTTFAGDVITTPATSVDTDGDGISDHLDLDSDNDGISDLVESGADPLVVDTGSDGVYDNTTVPGAQVDANGVPTAASGGVTPVDTDNDGVDDYLDLDSDNDGIADTVEAFATLGYTTNDGDVTNDDSDDDGIIDAFDSTAGHGGNFTAPEDTDGDGEADFIDIDSDNDRFSDIVESGLTLSGVDANGDGIDDNVGASYADPDGDIDAPISDLANNDTDVTDADYRSLNDKDGDGVADIVDLDDDNDGILDTEEGLSFTTATVDLSTYVEGATQQTFPLNSDVDVRITITGTNGNFDLVNGVQTPAFDPEGTGLVGNVDDLLVVFDPPNGNASPVIIEVEFFEAGTTNALLVNGVSTLVSDIDSSNPSDPDVGRRDRVTVNGFQGGTTGTSQPIDLALVNPTNATLDIVGNVATALDDDLAASQNTDTGSILVTTGPVDSLVFLYDEITGSADPARRGIGLLGNFTVDVPVVRDTDGDGVADHCDLDSDNDGISDLVESGDAAGIALDINGDGTIDLTEGVDTDGDGLMDVFEDGDLTADTGTIPVDSDGDLIDDYLDLDSDNDGIPDIVEGQPTDTYVALTGMDTDGDGVDNAFDITPGHGGDFTPVENTDGTDNPDYLDTDSDNDGLLDEDESGLTLTGIDANGDGIDDNVNASYADPDGDVNDPTVGLDNQTGDTSEVGYREVVTDLVTVKTLLSSDATPDEGDEVTFRIEVTNDGGNDATNVSLIDSLPAGITFTGGTSPLGTSYDEFTGVWTIGALANGGSAVLTLTGTVDVGQGGNTITNTTTAATGDQGDPSTVGDVLFASVTVNDVADLVTVKTLASGDATPEEGDEVTFLITVGNDGAAQATNVSLTDSLPAGITYTADSTSQGTYDPGTGVWNIGTLNVTDIATITLTGTVDVGQGGNTITNMTTAATGDQMDLSTAGDDLTAAVVIDNTTDLVTVKTLASGDATPNEGAEVTFQIRVTNNDGAQATNVSLTDSLPTGITLTGSTTSAGTSYNQATGLWTIGTLNEGAFATITLTGTVDVGQGGNTITNVTTPATGDQPDPSTAGDDLEEEVIVDANANLVTEKSLLSGDSTPDEGDMVTFQIQVTNAGGAQATNVDLTDLLPAGLTATANNGTFSQGAYNATTGLWTIGTLDNGATATLTLQGIVDVGQSGMTITNVTTAAAGDQPDPNTAGDDLEAEVVVNAFADLVTVKELTSGNSTPDEGETVTFEITVTNDGEAQATNVSLTDLLPAGLTFTASNVTQGTYNAMSGLFDIGTLNRDASATLTLAGTVDAGQGGNTITNMTTAAVGDQTDLSTVGDDLEEEVVVNNVADLVTVKELTSGNSTPNEGATVTFEITVTNNGEAQATNVSLTDLLPAGLTATGFNGTVTQGSYNPDSGLFTIGTIDRGASVTLTLQGIVDVGQGGNTITNVTTAAAGDQTDPSTAGDDLEAEVVVNAFADLVTVKELTSGSNTPDEGETVTFEITVTNDGEAQATNVSLTDLLPAGLTFTASNVTQGTYNAMSGLFDIGTLNRDASATLTLAGTVDAGQGGNTITNMTTAAVGDQTDLSTVGDDLEEEVVVNNVADLVTVKELTSGNSTPDEGNTVTFEITVTNNGEAQATNVSLTDLLPAGLTATGFNGTVTQGSYNPDSGLFTIGTIDRGASVTLTLQGIVDVGQGGNTITNVTTAAAGDQTDPSNTAGDDLEAEVVVNAFADLVTVKSLISGN